MKNTLIAILLLFTFQIQAQIPDSLEVYLPWTVMNLPNCESSMGEAPTSTNESVFIALESDELTLDASNECIRRIKKWVVLNWYENETYDFFQIGNVTDLSYAECETDFFLNYEDFPLVLSPTDLFSDFDPTHTYSFSHTDLNDNGILIDGNSEDNFEVFVYDHTAKSVCKSNVYLTKCEEDIVLDFPETAEVEFNGEPYIELTLEMLGASIVYPCGMHTVKILTGGGSHNRIEVYNVGRVVEVQVVIEFNNGVRYNKYIDVNVTGIKPPPIKMFIEEKSFQAGETIELDIWSESIEGLAFWQLQLNIENAKILDIGVGEIPGEVFFNIFDDGNSVNTVWTPLGALSMDLASDVTWFKLVLQPEISGNTKDIFSGEKNDYSAIGLEVDNYLYGVEADFDFNVAERDILSSTDQVEQADITLYPNPSCHSINISGIIPANTPTKIEIFDIGGSVVIQKEISNSGIDLNIDVSDLQSGLYILKMQNANVLTTHRFSKI